MQTESYRPEISQPEIEHPGDNPPPHQPNSDNNNGSSKRFRLATWIIGICIILYVASIPVGLWYRKSHRDTFDHYLEVPMQATSLLGGVEALGRGDWLSVARYGKDGTPTTEEWRMLGRVSSVTGNETEKKQIVLAVDPGQAPTLQAALAVKDGAPLVYNLSEEPTRPTETRSTDPNATAMPTPTATSTPFMAPPAIDGQVGLEIPAERIVSGANIAQQTLLSLVIVPKVVVDSEDAIFAALPFNGCAAYASFLDKDRLATDKMADAKTVVVWLTAARLPEAAAALTHAERVYLVPDASCESRQTPAATPIVIPTVTPSSTPSPAPSPTPPATPSPTTPSG